METSSPTSINWPWCQHRTSGLSRWRNSCVKTSKLPFIIGLRSWTRRKSSIYVLFSWCRDRIRREDWTAILQWFLGKEVSRMISESSIIQCMNYQFSYLLIKYHLQNKSWVIHSTIVDFCSKRADGFGLHGWKLLALVVEVDISLWEWIDRSMTVNGVPFRLLLTPA